MWPFPPRYQCARRKKTMSRDFVGMKQTTLRNKSGGRAAALQMWTAVLFRRFSFSENTKKRQ